MQTPFARWRLAIRPRSRTQMLIACAAVLAAAFGLTAWRTATVDRQNVALATCNFASDASRVLQARSRLFLESATEPVFAAIGGRAPVLGSAPLPSPAVLAQAAATVEQCHCAPQLSASLYFRFDVADDTLDRLAVVPGTTALSGSRAASPDQLSVDSAGVRRAITGDLRRLRDNGVFATAVTAGQGSAGPVSAVAVVLPKFDPAGRLRAVYGMLVPTGLFVTSVIGHAFDDAGLFAGVLADTSASHGWVRRRGSYRNRDVANLEVFDSRWRSLYRSGPMPDTLSGCIGMAFPDPALAGLIIDLGPLPHTYASWVSNSLPMSHGPLLVILLAGMLACGAAAGVTAHRDAELARLRSDFVTSISHELRMPLAQILLAGETLSLGRTRSQSERDDAADSIVREAQRLGGLVDNVLFFSRIEHHNVQTVLAPVDLAEIIADIVASVAPLAAGASATVSYVVPPHLVAMADRSAFRQVLYNLLDNAFKYGPAGQHVVVGAGLPVTASDRVRVWLDDEGPGIPQGQEAAIFEPFVRLNRSPDTAVAGSGLGLAVVRHLVANQGGHIWVDPSPRGRGSRFVLELARAHQSAPAVPSGDGNGVGALEDGH